MSSRNFAPAAFLLFLLTGSGCGGDDDVSPDADGDADADADTVPPEVSADPELPETIRPAGLLETTLQVTDPDSESFEWTVVEPAGATVDSATGAFLYRVPVDATGEIAIA